MLNRLRTPAVVLLSLLWLPRLAHGQAALSQESPRVERIVFEGVASLSEKELRGAIVTQETRCQHFVVRPLCMVSGSDRFRTVHELDREELARDELRIRVNYFRRGFRQVQVASEVVPEDDAVRVIFRVNEGPLTTISSVDVVLLDSVLTDADVQRARLPAQAGPLDLFQLDSATARLQGRLWDLGHARAEVEAETALDDGRHTAAVTVRVEPGPITTIRDLFVLGNERVTERTVLRLFEMREGDVFRRPALTAAQRRLWETELFQIALLDATPTEDSLQDIRIFVQEAPPRSLSVGPGFNTSEFVQGELRFTRYNWLGGARRLDTRLALGNILAPQLYGKAIFGSSPGVAPEDVDDTYLKPTWEVGVNFSQPFFLTTRMSLGLGASAYRRSLPGIVVDRGFSLNASLTRRLMDDLPVSLTYRFEQTHVDASEVYFCVNFGVCDPNTVGTLQDPHRLSPLGLEARLERIDDPTSLSDGYRVRALGEVASALTFSDFRHVRLDLDASRYQKVGRGVVAGRIHAGWVRPMVGVLDAFGFEQGGLPILHPRHRFYAGGARSVRGYGENQMGPRVLTVPPEELIQPADTASGVPRCTAATVVDGSCDPAVAPSEAFRPRPLGGNTLLEGSLEYRFPLSGSITGAVFVDAGLVYGRRVNFPPGDRAAVTPGFGFRYQSPLGPVRIDIGLRPTLVEDLPVVTQMVDADGELVLVQLERMKRYDPLGEGGGSFLANVFRRLQLHLALGEAF
jgi:outer membrane protein insertion porin family/translocation and assembly module TamA